MSTTPAPSIFPDCTTCIQYSLTPIHAAESEILYFSPFDTISPTVFTDAWRPACLHAIIFSLPKHNKMHQALLFVRGTKLQVKTSGIAPGQRYG